MRVRARRDERARHGLGGFIPAGMAGNGDQGRRPYAGSHAAASAGGNFLFYRITPLEFSGNYQEVPAGLKTELKIMISGLFRD